MQVEDSCQHLEVNYKSFDELENKFEENTPEQIFLYVSDKFEMENQTWIDEFNLLDDIRIVNKFYSSNVTIFLSTFMKFIQTSLVNLRSIVQKNASILVKEVYDERIKTIPEDFISLILPTIFECLLSAKSFVRQEALFVINNIENGSFRNTDFMVLNELCFHKSAKVQEQSCSSLLKIVKNQENLQTQNLLLIIQTSQKLYKGKRSILNKNAAEIIKFIANKMGMESLEIILQKSLEEQDFNQIIKTIVEILNKKQNSSQQPSLKDIMKQKKTNNEI